MSVGGGAGGGKRVASNGGEARWWGCGRKWGGQALGHRPSAAAAAGALRRGPRARARFSERARHSHGWRRRPRAARRGGGGGRHREPHTPRRRNGLEGSRRGRRACKHRTTLDRRALLSSEGAACKPTTWGKGAGARAAAAATTCGGSVLREARCPEVWFPTATTHATSRTRLGGCTPKLASRGDHRSDLARRGFQATMATRRPCGARARRARRARGGRERLPSGGQASGADVAGGRTAEECAAATCRSRLHGCTPEDHIGEEPSLR